MIGGLALHLQAFLLVAGCACAADKEPDSGAWTGTEPSAIREQDAPTALEGGKVTIDGAACRFLVKHQPRADVTYQPGVDLTGRAVAPADLEENVHLPMPDSLTIDITPDLTKWLPNNNPPYDRLTNSKVNIGTVTLSGDTVTMNGQPLSPAAQENLAVLCLQQTR